MKTIKNIATRTYQISACSAFCLIFISACSALPAPPVHPVVYDFGPGSVEPVAPRPPTAARSALVLADIQSPGVAVSSTALHYRLAYDDAQQLRAYQGARWSRPPAELVRQSVASELAQQWPVLDSLSAREAARGAAGAAGAAAGAGSAVNAGAMLVLRLDIEEFSQVFSSAAQSSGVLRLRATLAQTTPQGERLRGQRLFVAQSPAASQDAAGGSAAMARAAQQVAHELALWIEPAAR